MMKIEELTFMDIYSELERKPELLKLMKELMAVPQDRRQEAIKQMWEYTMFLKEKRRITDAGSQS